MLAKRIIPCLDVDHGRVVKGKQFQNLRDVDDPVKLGKWYSECGADELVFYDITATHEKRALFVDVVRAVAAGSPFPLRWAAASAARRTSGKCCLPGPTRCPSIPRRWPGRS